jgi:hypothetical protein
MPASRRSLEPTARGRILLALAGASVLGAWLSGDPNVRLAAALLTAPLVVDLARKPRGLAAVAVHVAPRRTVVGAPFHDEVRLENRGAATLRELVVAEERTRAAPALVDALRSGATARTVLACTAPHRGHRRERSFELQTEWPLGLFRARAVAVAATDFVTEPRRTPVPVAALRASAASCAAPQTHRQLPGDDFHALREHDLAEDARGVHALRSAALGELVRTVVRGQHPQQIGIVLDLRRPPGRHLHHGRGRFEWGLGACATLLDEFTARAVTAVVVVIGAATVHARVRSPAEHRELLTLLAEAAPGPHRALEPDALGGLVRLEHCIWIAAGGFLQRGEHTALPAGLHVLDGEWP